MHGQSQQDILPQDLTQIEEVPVIDPTLDGAARCLAEVDPIVAGHAPRLTHPAIP